MAIHIQHIETPEGLEDRISQRVFQTMEKQRQLHLRAQLVAESIVSIVTFASFVPLTLSLTQSLEQSGFFGYVSVLFSGDAGIALYWKELGLSIVESLPLLTISLALSVALVFIISATKTISTFKTAHTLKTI